MARANTPRWCGAPRKPSSAATCSRSCRASFSPTPCADPPSLVFHRLRQANPAPYGALINLGEGEFLVSASPEMFVRVEGRRIETCPISGTIARGRDAIEDADRILELLNSKKDESELTMCTDVDRNDKSRVCVAGSVQASSGGARSRCIRASFTRSIMSRASCAPNSMHSTGFSATPGR